MSEWDVLGIEAKIIEILASVPDAMDDHHLGRPFLTAYQIAIEFRDQYKAEFDKLDLPIGGSGTGQRTSLSQYLARELSRRIHTDKLPEIEGGFLSNQHLSDISFKVVTESGMDVIHSSLTDSGFTLSMFRLRDRSDS